MTTRNIRVCERDSASLFLEWTDDEPDDQAVFATIGAAKAEVVARSIPERDAWARMVNTAREWTTSDVKEEV